jgi:hypothetical protein
LNQYPSELSLFQSSCLIFIYATSCLTTENSLTIATTILNMRKYTKIENYTFHFLPTEIHLDKSGKKHDPMDLSYTEFLLKIAKHWPFFPLDSNSKLLFVSKNQSYSMVPNKERKARDQIANAA